MNNIRAVNFNEADLITCFAIDYGYENWKNWIEEFNHSNSLFDQQQIEYNIGDNIRNLNFKIIKESKDCDIFINLVHNYYHQTDLLLELHKSWKGLQKYIINIGTSAVDNGDFGVGDYQMSEYKVQKTTLVDMITTLKKSFQYPILKLYVISEINFDTDISNLNSIIENECKLSKT